MQYYFPAWFCYKALEIAVRNMRSQEVKVTITVRGVQPLSAEIWNRICMNDDQGIRVLMTSGLVKPNDTQQQSGLSLLIVGHFSVTLKCINIFQEL